MSRAPGIERLLDVMRRLRDPDSGCPWDLEQTFETIAPYTIEEAYEVADAIERRDPADLKSELGDLLLQVVYHAQMAEEARLFTFEDVASSVGDKMVRRHPHVFGDQAVANAEAQRHAWEELKAAERSSKTDGEAGLLDDVPLALPALARAVKLQKRAARVGFDWPEPAQVLDKLDEELAELRDELSAGAQRPQRIEDEIGDLLFTMANLARRFVIDPEEALRRANRKFERRFREVERALAADGRAVGDTPLDELEALWQQAKLKEFSPEAS